MSIKNFYTKTVDIERATVSDDDIMGYERTWVKIHPGLACCIQPRSGFESVVHDKRQSEVSHVMYCDVVDIQPSDRVNDGGKYYDILDARDIDMLGRFLTIDLTEIIE